MKRFEIDAGYEADCRVGEEFRAGEIYHAARNVHGGAVLTPVGRFFCTRPRFAESLREHWRVDCYVRDHKLAPDPERAGKALAAALLREGLCTEPVWVSWYKSAELGGKAHGELFERE